MDKATPLHHPDADALLEYASGALPEAESVMVATHLALCPACRAEVRDLETLGGVLVEAQEPVSVGGDVLSAVMARLDEDEPDSAPITTTPAAFDDDTLLTVPNPLRSYLGSNLGDLKWRTRAPGIKEASVEIPGSTVRASMLRIAPGESVPSHTHDGVETTLVLKGAFSDETGRYARGDVATAHDDLDHTPIADAHEECICFIVVDGSLKLTSPLGRVLNLFVRP